MLLFRNFLLLFDNAVFIDKINGPETIEKIKSISTSKQMTVNEKFVTQFTIPFYGKIILATNAETRFMKVEVEEIRFWVRKLNRPEAKNTNIEQRVAKEIPAFLYFLSNRKLTHDEPKSRMYFDPEELSNHQLNIVKDESRSWLYKELCEEFTEYFSNNSDQEIRAIPKDLKKEFFDTNSKVEISYIRRVLKEEFEFELAPNGRYQPFGLGDKTGTPFIIPRDRFVEEESKPDDDLPF